MALPENYMGAPLTKEEGTMNQTCTAAIHGDSVDPDNVKDYSSYLNFLMCYTLLAIWTFVVFYRAKWKRTKEDGPKPNDADDLKTSGPS